MARILISAIFFSSVFFNTVSRAQSDPESTKCGRIPLDAIHYFPPSIAVIRSRSNPTWIQCIGVLIKRNDLPDKSNVILISSKCRVRFEAKNKNSFYAIVGTSVVEKELVLLPILKKLNFPTFSFARTVGFIDFDQTAQPICLPQITDNEIPRIGFTIREFNRNGKWELQQRRVDVTDDQTCQDEFGSIYNSQRMFCGLYADNEGGVGYDAPFYAHSDKTGGGTVFGFNSISNGQVVAFDRTFPIQLNSYLHLAMNGLTRQEYGRA